MSYILLFIGMLFTQKTMAITLYLMDFDNTIVEHREEYKGGFDTPHKLYLVERRTDVILPDYEEYEPIIELSSWDFERVKDKLSKGPGFPGNTIPITLTDGRKFIPGIYEAREINSYETYEYFGKSFQGRNFLLEQQLAAEKNVKNNNTDWRGRFFSLFQAALNVKTNIVAILTMRNHSQEDFIEWSSHLLKRKLINRTPDHFISARSSSMDHYDLEGRPNVRKVNYAIEQFKELQKVPINEEEIKLDQDGRALKPLHTLIFADDNTATVDLFAEKMKALVARNSSKVKVIFLSADFHSNIRKKAYYEQTVIKANGSFRKAKLEELIGEPNITEKEKKKILSHLQVNYCQNKMR